MEETMKCIRSIKIEIEVNDEMTVEENEKGRRAAPTPNKLRQRQEKNNEELHLDPA
jgi:hypothetical protein